MIQSYPIIETPEEREKILLTALIDDRRGRAAGVSKIDPVRNEIC